MGQTISNISHPPTMTVSKEHYDNLLHKFQNMDKKLQIFEKTNQELKAVIGEKDNTINTLQRDYDMIKGDLEYKDTENISLEKENTYNINKLNLAQNRYDKLKKEFDIASNALADKDDIIYKNNTIIEDCNDKIEEFNKKLSSYQNEDKQQDLEINSLKEKNAELRKQAISTQEELNKFKQQFTLINNIVDEVID